MKPIAQRLALLVLMLALSACAAIPPPEPFVPTPGQWTIGEAAWYGELHQGMKTASGEYFDRDLLTGAHSTLPLGATVEVRNAATGKTTRVLINDRANRERRVDLLISKAAASELDVLEEPRFWVEYRWVE